MVKGEIAQNEHLHLFPPCFLCNLYLKIFLIVTLQLFSAAYFNLIWSQNHEIGNGLTNLGKRLLMILLEMEKVLVTSMLTL